MKHALLLLLALLLPAPLPAASAQSAAHSPAACVHVALRSTSDAPASGDFVTLAQIAALSGGTAAARARLAAVPVGRAPMPGETRLLTPGDVVLKLRQAGFHPERDIVLEGAKQVSVTASSASDPAPLPLAAPVSAPPASMSSAPASPLPDRPAAPAVVVRPNDSVTITVREGAMLVTAKGTARQPGAVGQIIRVHRDGAASDISATVVDSQTVLLEP